MAGLHHLHPDGVQFIDIAALERLTGERVRIEYRTPGEAKSLPAADAALACPLTFNSVNEFAHGHADNFAIMSLLKREHRASTRSFAHWLTAPDSAEKTRTTVRVFTRTKVRQITFALVRAARPFVPNLCRMDSERAPALAGAAQT